MSAYIFICIKTVDENFNNFIETFEVVSLHRQMATQALFDEIRSKVFSIVGKNKLASDWAKIIRGRNKGLLGILNKNGINFPAFHCIIH